DYNGIDLLKDIKIYSPETIVIMISGSMSLETPIESISEGADGYLSKPISLEQIEYNLTKFYTMWESKKNIKKISEILVNIETDQNLSSVYKKIISSEKKYKYIFDNSPIPLMEEDWSEVCEDLLLIKNNELNFEEHFKLSSEDIVKYCKKIKILNMNQSALELAENNTPSEYVGKYMSERMIKNILDFCKEKILMILKNEETVTKEISIKSFLGVEKTVIVCFKADIKTEKNYSKVLISLADITNQKNIENKILKSDREWEQTFDTVPALVCILDKNYNILKANKVLTNTIDLEPEQCIGCKCYELFHKEKIPPNFCLLEKTFQTKKPHTEILFSSPILKNGEFYPNVFELSTYPLEEDGEVNKVLHIARDITVEYMSKDKIKKTMIKLKESNKDLEQFAYVASHDLQEPLRKITAFGSLLKDSLLKRGSISEEEILYLEKMTESSNRMRNMIDDLLEYSRISIKEERFKLCNLNKIIEELITKIFDVAIKETNAQINIEKLPEIECDETQIRQVFQNILSNSFKFRSKKRNLVVGISSETSEENKTCTIRIKDNGIGFEQKYDEKIFLTFQKLHGREEYPGSGIGLAICKKIISRHKGTITVKSIIDEETVFEIELPLKRD
ncbi:MAG TPA: ATP-binding protein, partial [Candidatus Paceibacterota bacterium]|nr:ATP-binding protein [Candidatus Paceibacterota bacterium]